MRTRIALTWALTCALLASSIGNAAPRQAVGGALDLGVHVARDDTLVPLAHTGPRLTLSPRYFGDFGVGLALADARLGFAYVRGREGEEGLTSVWGLHGGFCFFLHEGRRSGVALGPTLGWDNESFYFGDWDDAHPYWLGTLWVGPRVHAFRRISSAWRADLDGQVALIGWYSRPPGYRHRKQEMSTDLLAFLEWPTHDLEPGWLADFQVVRASLDFYHTRSPARVPQGLGLGAELGFSHAKSPDLVVSLEALWKVSYTWGLL